MLTASQAPGATATRPYVGRFAPSPTGALHAGSLVAAMASYLDARAHGGRWLVRIEDADQARTVAGAAESMLSMLAAFGMPADGDVVWQSRRGELYAAAFERLQSWVYPCACSRREIADSNGGRHASADGGLDPAALVYPGTCKSGLAPGRSARAWRVRVPETGAPGDCIGFQDRACGWQHQTLSRQAGDFVIRRADGFWAYQLAVVVDDAAQDVTHVVRGMDLLDSTPRQIHLQRLLGVPRLEYLHVPLVRNTQGEKLSKQTGASALDAAKPLPHLMAAAEVLGLELKAPTSVDRLWSQAVECWQQLLQVGGMTGWMESTAGRAARPDIP